MEYPSFEPLFRNPHVATIAANFWPRPGDGERFPVEDRYVETEAGVKVLVRTQRPNRRARGEVVLVHGLEGSSESGYMRSLAQALLEQRYVVHRANIRSCGGTERLCRTLYHAGLTSDLRALAEGCGEPPLMVGFSLGGNQVLKLAGELGAQAVGRIAGVVAISTPLDLLACARKLERGAGKIYTRHFLRSMKARLRRRASEIDFEVPWERVRRAKTLFELDDCVTGPAFGFRGAEHYYETQSAKNFLSAIRVPALVVQAIDDPMVDFRVFGHTAFRENADVTLLVTRHGGHMGFLSRNETARFWVDSTVRQWAADVLNVPAR